MSRVDPQSATESIPALAGIKESRRGGQLDLIRAGDDEKQSNKVFPGFQNRQYQDLWAGLLFGISALGVVGLAIKFVLTREDDAADIFSQNDIPMTFSGLKCYLFGIVVSFLVAICMSKFFEFFPECFCKFTLIMKPLIFLALTIGAFYVQPTAADTVVNGEVTKQYPMWMGLAPLTLIMACVTACFWKYIPFTSMILKTVGNITSQHPKMIIVSFVGAFFSAAWIFALALATAALDPGVGVIFGIFFYMWGAPLFTRISYVTFCGVYGRWYFGGQPGVEEEVIGSFRENQTPLVQGKGDTTTPSLKVALTTSFGSISFGSLIIAVIRLMQAVAAQGQKEAASEGNVVLCIIACCIRCCLDCIGDVIEYINDWAYVQCAIRGSSYIKSAKITFSLCKCSNIPALWGASIVTSCVMMVTLMAGIASGVVTAVTGDPERMQANLIVGTVLGMFVANCSICMIDAGAKTILACWAEDPKPLQEHHPDFHNALEKVLGC